MDLRNFIKETLIQLTQGIEDAADELNDSSAIVNPRHFLTAGGTTDSQVYGFLGDEKDSSRQVVQRIDFDVAVSVAAGTETKGGLGIMVGAIALGSHGKSDSTNTSQSRIRFSVPLVLPTRR